MTHKMDSRSLCMYTNTTIRYERQSIYACDILIVVDHGTIDNYRALTRRSGVVGFSPVFAATVRHICDRLKLFRFSFDPFVWHVDVFLLLAQNRRSIN